MSKKVNHFKGIVLGSVGGAVGVLAMEGYWKAASLVVGRDPREKGGGNTGGDESGSDRQEEGPLDDISLVGKHYKEGEASTEALGRHEYETVTGKEPNPQTKNLLGYLNHYAFGVAGAAAYGAIRGRARIPDLAGGLVLAVLLWGLANELAVPLLGLSEGPTASPPQLHAHTLAAHITYGLATSATTQVLEKVM